MRFTSWDVCRRKASLFAWTSECEMWVVGVWRFKRINPKPSEPTHSCLRCMMGIGLAGASNSPRHIFCPLFASLGGWDPHLPLRCRSGSVFSHLLDDVFAPLSWNLRQFWPQKAAEQIYLVLILFLSEANIYLDCWHVSCSATSCSFHFVTV